MQDLILLGIVSFLIFLAPLINSLTKIPIVVVEMLLGAFVANIGINIENEMMKDVAHIGFLFLMFLAGIEVDIKTFRSLGKNFLKKMISFFFILYSSTIIVVLLCDLSIVYVIALPVMSLGMIITLIQDYGKNEFWIDLSLKIGIIGELISISMLVLLDGYYSFGMGLDLYKSLGVLFVFLFCMIVVFKLTDMLFWWFPSLRLILIPTNGVMNQDIRYSMMIFFIMIVIVSLLDIEVALGAFLSGIVISSFFKYNKELHHKLSNFGFGFLIPLFFVYTGSTINIDAIIHDFVIIKHAIYISMAMVLVRFIATCAVFSPMLKNIKNILLFSFSASMPLTFLVATATLALNINAIDRNEYYSFVLAAMMEGILFTVFIKLIFNFKKF